MLSAIQLYKHTVQVQNIIVPLTEKEKWYNCMRALHTVVIRVVRYFRVAVREIKVITVKDGEDEKENMTT
jgi:hypothetical protein